MLERLDVD